MFRIERYFNTIKDRVVDEFGDQFDPIIFKDLSLSFNDRSGRNAGANDHYRSKRAKVPAYYNPNTHSIHLNLPVLRSAHDQLVENIIYHELIHAASNHCRIDESGLCILKSGLKLQIWIQNNRQTTLHRHLNEGVTQYFANTQTMCGPAYRQEVTIVGRLIQKIGLTELKGAYFGSALRGLIDKTNITLGSEVFQTIARAVDEGDFETANALLS